MGKYRYLDLFAGCGGLSLGLEKSGFELALAVEKSDMAAETFYHNFIARLQNKEEWKDFCSLPPNLQAEQGLVVDEVARLLDNAPLKRWLKNQDIDLIAGGPPCQGFSMAGRRNPEDIRNKLPWQFLEVVELVQPKAVIIENVVGMSHNFIKHEKEAPFDQLKIALEQIKPGYTAQQIQLNAMHFGAPQHRPRVLILAIRNDLAGDFQFVSDIWRSDFDENTDKRHRPDIAPEAHYFGKNIKTVKHALWDISDKGYKYKAENEKYFDPRGSLARDLRQDRIWMPKSIAKLNEQVTLENHNLRKHADHIQERFRLYQVLRDQDIPSRILNIPKNHKAAEARHMLQGLLNGTNSKFVAPDGITIAKNKKDLIELILCLGTKKHSQRPLHWDLPSPTVVSLPDDFVHPSSPRTMTVRELARFQTFPDSFVFRAKETTGSHRRRFEVPQYTQVGNAVPPIMAEAIGKRIFSLLQSQSKTYSQGGRKIRMTG